MFLHYFETRFFFNLHVTENNKLVAEKAKKKFKLTRKQLSKYKRIKGVVDKVFDAVETFHAHIWNQRSRLPQKIS